MEEELTQVWVLNCQHGRPVEGSALEQEWKDQTKRWIQEHKALSQTSDSDADIDAMVQRIVDRVSRIQKELQPELESATDSVQSQSKSIPFSLLLGAGAPKFFLWEQIRDEQAFTVHKAMMDLEVWEDVEPDWPEISNFLKVQVLEKGNNDESLDWSKVYAKWYGMMRSALSSTISMVADLIETSLQASIQSPLQTDRTNTWLRLWWFMWMDVHLIAGNKTIHYPVFQEMGQRLCNMFLFRHINSQSRSILEILWVLDPTCRWLRVWSNVTSEWLDQSKAADSVSQILSSGATQTAGNTHPENVQIWLFCTQLILSLSSTTHLSWIHEAKRSLVRLLDKCYLCRMELMKGDQSVQQEDVAILCIQAVSQWMNHDEMDKFISSQEFKASLRKYYAAM